MSFVLHTWPRHLPRWLTPLFRPNLRRGQVHVALLLCLCAAAVFAEDSHGQLTLGSGDVDVLKDFELAPAGGGPVSNARDSTLDIQGARDELAKMAAVSKNATAHA